MLATHPADGAKLLVQYCLAVGGWGKSASAILRRARWVDQSEKFGMLKGSVKLLAKSLKNLLGYPQKCLKHV